MEHIIIGVSTNGGPLFWGHSGIRYKQVQAHRYATKEMAEAVCNELNQDEAQAYFGWRVRTWELEALK